MGRLGWPVALATLALGACGASATPASDGAVSDVAPAVIAADGSGTFTVTATLTFAAADAQHPDLAGFPRTHTFTMFVEAGAERLVAGASGQVSSVVMWRTGKRAFEAREPVRLPLSFARACGDTTSVVYDQLGFSVQGGRLIGTASGSVSFLTPTRVALFSVTATITGMPDAELPTIETPTETINPMGEGTFFASEPLGESAASLIGAEGDVFALGAVIALGPPAVTTGFVRSTLMLNWGTTYELTTEALTDLAGHMGSRFARPKVATPPLPPLAVADGFESVESSTFGGAAVMTGGPLTPLAGVKSLILIDGFPDAFPYPASQSLALRLAIPQAGGTGVRFSARMVAMKVDSLAQASFGAFFRAGVPGREVSVVSGLLSNQFVEATLPEVGTVYLSPEQTVEVALPAGATGEVSFQILRYAPDYCEQPPPVALIIDDLRVE